MRTKGASARRVAILAACVLAIGGAGLRLVQLVRRPSPVRPGSVEASTALRCRSCGRDTPLETLFGATFAETNLQTTAEGVFVYRCPDCGSFETETIAELEPR
jgi:predicted RNA-binding Zn-ribbon protein involved in translation (DUF1610 family)